MVQQVSCEGNFGWEQNQDDSLKHCWGQLHLLEVEDLQTGHLLHRHISSYMGDSSTTTLIAAANLVMNWWFPAPKST